MEQLSKSHKQHPTADDLKKFLEAARLIAHDVLPSLSHDDLHRIMPEQLTAIVGLAAKRVEQVRDLIARMEGNARGPATTKGKRRSPARKSSVPSAPRSSV